MRTVTVYTRHPDPGEVLPGVRPFAALPRVGETVRIVGDGTARLGHVSAVDRDGGTYSVQLDGALTPRERQVLRLLARGLRDREIMRELGIGYQTVRHHAHEVYRKLGMSGRGEAREWVRRLGL